MNLRPLIGFPFVLGFSWVVVVVLTALVNVRRDLLFATVFAPFGTLLRWKLSPLNAMNANFPFGTFIANIVGTICLSVLFILGNGEVSTNIGCQVIAGLSDGFCGCLTTISTFAVEITTLSKSHAYRYGIVSLVTAQIAMVIIVGTYDWTITLKSTC